MAQEEGTVPLTIEQVLDKKRETEEKIKAMVLEFQKELTNGRTEVQVVEINMQLLDISAFGKPDSRVLNGVEMRVQFSLV